VTWRSFASTDRDARLAVATGQSLRDPRPELRQQVSLHLLIVELSSLAITDLKCSD